jgi:threonine dehydratase
MTDLAITAADVRDAAAQIRGVAVRTPLLEFMPLSERWDIACW